MRLSNSMLRVANSRPEANSAPTGLGKAVLFTGTTRTFSSFTTAALLCFSLAVEEASSAASWPADSGGGRSASKRTAPTLVTVSRTEPTRLLVWLSMSSRSLKRLKAKMLPKKWEEIMMAQKRPALRDMVAESEFRDRKLPFNTVHFRSDIPHRRRINTDEKAKVVAAGWGTYLNAAPTILAARMI